MLGGWTADIGRPCCPGISHSSLDFFRGGLWVALCDCVTLCETLAGQTLRRDSLLKETYEYFPDA